MINFYIATKYDYEMGLQFTIQLGKNGSEVVSTVWKRFSCFVFAISQLRNDLRSISPSLELSLSWQIHQ